MKRIDIGGSVMLDEIALGACSPERQDTTAIMDAYYDLGGRTFDSARSYFDGEYDAFLGKWIRERGVRGEVTVVMKGCRNEGPVSRLSHTDIKGQLEQSLQKAGLDYTDLYLLHRDDPGLPVEGIMTALDELVREGKTKAVGVSNWTAGRIAQANAFAKKNGLAPLRVCQLHFSLAMTTAAITGDIAHVPMSDAEYSWYRDNDFPVMAFASQGKGFFAQYAAGKGYKPTVEQYYAWLPENLRRAKRVAAFARKVGVSPSAIALAYLRVDPLRSSALVGFSSLVQFQESMTALSLNLDAEERLFLETGNAFR